MSFQCLDQNGLGVDAKRCARCRGMVEPGWRSLFVMGLAEPMPTLVNWAEQQAKCVASVLAGNDKMPDDAQMETQIKADEKLYLGHFYNSERHTIQSDVGPYVSDLKKELRGHWIA